MGQIELAARAHYPHDYIRAAEAGPALPDLPLLSAYVRGCGGTLEDWEERWRQLTNTPALTLLPIRSAGASTAASAGSRIGLAYQDADAPDPAAIMAALNRVAEKIAADTSSPPRPPRPAPSPAESRPAEKDRAAAPRAAASTSASAAASAMPETAEPAAAAPGTGTTTGGSTSRGGSTRARRSFSMTSRTTIAALIALAICVIVAVLAVFA